MTWFTGDSPYSICRQLVSELYGPIYRGIFSDIFPLLPASNFPTMVGPAKITWPLKKAHNVSYLSALASISALTAAQKNQPTKN
jgi:hypothetical protein